MDNEYMYQPRKAWKTYAASRDILKLFAQEYADFLNQCKTERETVEYVRAKLVEAGFQENLASDKGFAVLRGKALFAYKAGKKDLETGLKIIASHADSPRLDFKQHPFVENSGIVQAKTHYYGGIRKYQWLARPLALHGVIITGSGKRIDVRIGDKPGDPVFCVADLLPHLAQKQMDKSVKDAFEGEKLNIVLGSEPAKGKDDENAIKQNLLNLLHKKYGVDEEDFITAELEAVPAERAGFAGLDESLIGGYGQDDRICVFCALKAFLEICKNPLCENNLAVIFWDKEEIGSDGATGASSRFFQYCVEDVARNAGKIPSHILLNSQAISADVTAALDPDYPDVHEKNNAALLGNGPCFSKFTGSRGKYGASEADAEFFGRLRRLLNSYGIPWQAAELGKVDLGGGGTVAMFLAAYGMEVIDLGPALLSMHSPFELSSVADLYATYSAYKTFLEE